MTPYIAAGWPMTIYERALDFVADGAFVGLGSGRASTEFIKLVGQRVRAGLHVRGVPTSQTSAELARSLGIPLVSLEEGMPIAVTVDGADEVDPHLNLIKGYGRALVREKIVAAASRMLVILVGPGKTTPALGTRDKLPVEVIPFALPLCRARLIDLGLRPVAYEVNGKLFVTDNGNAILDCGVDPIADPAALEARIQAIPGVVGTGLFLDMADIVLIGDDEFQLKEERRRGAAATGR
jgi:ribose 5-phosphate isomerase A